MRSRLLSQSWAFSVLMSRSIGFAGGTRAVPPEPWECLALILGAHGARGRPRGGVDPPGAAGEEKEPRLNSPPSPHPVFIRTATMAMRAVVLLLCAAAVSVRTFLAFAGTHTCTHAVCANGAILWRAGGGRHSGELHRRPQVHAESERDHTPTERGHAQKGAALSPRSARCVCLGLPPYAESTWCGARFLRQSDIS